MGSRWLGLSRLCLATFEQLLAFGATFCDSNNLEQILLFWAHIKHERVDDFTETSVVRVVMGDSVLSQWRAIEGTLINFIGTQILRRRRRKVFFPSLLWKRSYRPTESTLISAPVSIKTFVFSVPVKKRRRTISRLTCVRGKKEGRRLFFSSWAFCDCGILEIFCCSYCLAVIQKLAKNLIFTGVGIRKAATYAPKGRGDFR